MINQTVRSFIFYAFGHYDDMPFRVTSVDRDGSSTHRNGDSIDIVPNKNYKRFIHDAVLAYREFSLRDRLNLYFAAPKNQHLHIGYVSSGRLAMEVWKGAFDGTMDNFVALVPVKDVAYNSSNDKLYIDYYDGLFKW